MADPDTLPKATPDLAPDALDHAEGPVRVRLPEKLDTAAAEHVHAELARFAGRDLTLDFGKVTMLGALCLQVLLNARDHWSSGGHAITVSNVLPGVEKAFVEFGITETSLTTGVAI